MYSHVHIRGPFSPTMEKDLKSITLDNSPSPRFSQLPLEYSNTVFDPLRQTYTTNPTSRASPLNLNSTSLFPSSGERRAIFSPQKVWDFLGTLWFEAPRDQEVIRNQGFLATTKPSTMRRWAREECPSLITSSQRKLHDSQSSTTTMDKILGELPWKTISFPLKPRISAL